MREGWRAAPILPQPATCVLRYHQVFRLIRFASISHMNIPPEISALAPEMSEWRHHIHAHPETAFEELATAAFVADKLKSFGLEVHTGLAKTGVVGVLRGGNGASAAPNAIGLRADLDALHIQENSGVPDAS